MKRERRFHMLQKIGCICCYINGINGVPADVHHIVDKGYRAHSGGDAATLPLCPWHHRGVPPSGMSEDTSLLYAGPSLALHKKRFVREFGTERELLAKVNGLLEELERAA